MPILTSPGAVPRLTPTHRSSPKLVRATVVKLIKNYEGGSPRPASERSNSYPTATSRMCELYGKRSAAAARPEDTNWNSNRHRRPGDVAESMKHGGTEATEMIQQACSVFSVPLCFLTASNRSDPRLEFSRCRKRECDATHRWLDTHATPHDHTVISIGCFSSREPRRLATPCTITAAKRRNTHGENRSQFGNRSQNDGIR